MIECSLKGLLVGKYVRVVAVTFDDCDSLNNMKFLVTCDFSDVSIEAPPSMYPAKKYCDITGFEVSLHFVDVCCVQVTNIRMV